MNKSTLHYLLILLLLAGCAQQRGLTGGEKDTTSPLIISASPENGTIQFTGNEFTITFDEYVQLNAISQELIVSPPLRKQPKVKIKQKSIVVKWEEELLPNTTYVFNFGNGIADVNEKNIAEDLTYVFSTGNEIDSLRIIGKVWNASLDEACKSIKVLAFDQDTTILTKKPQPVYFARTKEDGSYTLSYMRENTYHLYALDDINGNYRYDNGEAIAFLETAFNLEGDNSDTVNFFLSTPRFETPVVNDYDTDSIGLMRFAWDPFFEVPDITSSGDLQFVRRLNETQDTIEIHFTERPTDRFEEVYVSWRDTFRDTVNIPFYEEAQSKPFKLGHSIDKRMRLDQKMLLRGAGSIELSNSGALQLFEDSVEIAAIIAVSGDQFEVVADRKPGKKYLLNIWPGAFRNAVGQTNDSLNLSFSTLRPEDLGELILKLQFADEMKFNVFQLYDKNGKEVYRARNIQPGELRIPNLTAGEYTASFLHDRNNNGLFDPAIFNNKTSSERVYKLAARMNVRSNWELRQNWTIQE